MEVLYSTMINTSCKNSYGTAMHDFSDDVIFDIAEIYHYLKYTNCISRVWRILLCILQMYICSEPNARMAPPQPPMKMRCILQEPSSNMSGFRITHFKLVSCDQGVKSCTEFYIQVPTVQERLISRL